MNLIIIGIIVVVLIVISVVVSVVLSQKDHKSSSATSTTSATSATSATKLTIDGNENDTANFTCAVKSGTIIYGTQPDKVVTFNVPVGTQNIQVTNGTMGSDPNPGVFKKWGAYYTC